MAGSQEYKLYRKVLQLGPSFAVSFPRWLAEAKGLRRGDKVAVKFDGYSGIFIERVSEDTSVAKRTAAKDAGRR
jgi:antitoxin component of MazEF toxin-antitoxin module